jgi:monovalent cation:H+ antiporter-2, CPA2 family
MPHETELIALIAVGFVAALALGYLATLLRMPPLVGYLLAGVAIGPFTPGFVADGGLAQQLAEVGVILLMFGVGLHFSIAALWEQRRVALPGAVVQILVATGVGALVATWWGWSLMAGLVLGLSLSVASTVVLLRALEERNELASANGRIAVGWLIVEDLVMVLALVFLPALAPEAAGGTGGGSRALGVELLLLVGKVALFVALMLVGGRRVVPWLLARVAATGSRELFTLSVLAIALGIAYGSAELFGVSFALGAFFAGVILAESDFSHEAAEKSLPLQDAFAVLFFVSVGMLFDPAVLVQQPLAVLALLVIVIIVKSAAAFLIVVAFGHSTRTALTISASLAQIGEFSFILAGLGVSLQLLPAEGRDLILAAALLSITLNPLVFAGIRPFDAWLARRPGLARLHRGRLDEPRDGGDATALAAALTDHAVLVGYGRVGEVIGRCLAERGRPLVVIERNDRVLERVPASAQVVPLLADAASPGVLAAANLRAARLLVIASPDSFGVRQMLGRAREMNPALRIIVRTHSAPERDWLLRAGADQVVLGEEELAATMCDHALAEPGLKAYPTA